MRTTITPEMAKALLDNNTVNRNVKKSALDFLTNEILRGRFLYNGESIIIATDGTLLDGQHRLMACVNSGISIDVELVQNVDITVMPTIDTGCARSASDVFSISGIKGYATVSGAVKNVLSGIGTKRTKFKGEGGFIKISNDEILRYYNSHSNSFDVLYEFSSHLYNTGARILPPAKISAFIYLLSLESENDNIYKFFREIITGVKLSDSNVAQMLRTKLINEKISNYKFSNRQKVSLIIKAFRLYNKNKIRKTLSLQNDEIVNFVDFDLNFQPNLNLEYIENQLR